MSKKNGMKKVSLSRLKDLVKCGAAINVTQGCQIPKPYAQIAYSMGVQGINGALYKTDDGKLYAICGRLMCLDQY